ncbi:ubiquitin-like domain-containing protein [Paenibacillus campi]|uniref:ubiquitin-like domain-containing protein n=1 Tax=Paenibacillus campi TaxID=3106031 RepID=UPI002AFEC787|nr:MULTISPECIES: ubiquitin-like domain-containing protein [unclassified Paenibacillus]
MGIAPFKETHGSRSSSMSYALRWKQKNLRSVLLTSLAVVVVIAMALWLMYTQSSKNIYVVIDGKAHMVETHKLQLSDLLAEQNINVAPQDKVSMPMNGAIQNGDKVFINHAVAVNLRADGYIKQVYTTADTVGSALDQLGIKLGPKDKLDPPIEAAIKPDMDIRVTRTTSVTSEQVVETPYQTIEKKDGDLLKGKTKVVQEGQNGKVVQYIEKVFEDGEFVSKQMVNKKTVSEVKDKIVAIGTKKEEPKPVVVSESASSDSSRSESSDSSGSDSRSNKDFSYAKVLNNVTLTAYSSQEPGLGTRTASGTRVTEGRTIAVDTDVIPMGWWVYIEGIGYRRAEDTGSAINGKKIDVYIDSLTQAREFGRKTGYTVYVIGPVKP